MKERFAKTIACPKCEKVKTYYTPRTYLRYLNKPCYYCRRGKFFWKDEEGRYYTVCTSCQKRKYHVGYNAARCAANNHTQCYSCVAGTPVIYTPERLAKLGIHQTSNKWHIICKKCGTEHRFDVMDSAVHVAENRKVIVNEKEYPACYVCRFNQIAEENKRIAYDNLRNGEVLVPINKFPGYSISNYGNVYNDKWEKLIPQVTGGHYFVMLYKNKIPTCSYIGRLVAQHFVPNPNKYFGVEYLDGNRKHHKFTNLQWTCHKKRNSK